MMPSAETSTPALQDANPADAAPGTRDGDGLIPRPTAAGSPALGWRGLLLDSARTFWSVDDVLEILDIMARYRLNRLHWHLTDDAGWRFAVPGWGKVVEVGAHLPREPFVWYSNVDQAKRESVIAAAPDGSASGWYTDEDIARVVGHAARLGIEVMPEMDLPGHMAAVIRAYPELGDPALANIAAEDWTHRNDLLWPHEASHAFLRAALGRVCDLFPMPLVHIGGDECDYRVWEADGELMARMREEDVHDAKALQGRFTDLARSTLTARGRDVAAWDEVTETPCDGDEIIFGWREEVGVTAARNSGNPWIFADADVLYLNRLSGPTATEPCGMFGTISLTDILNVELPQDNKLRGIQAAAWCEFMPDRAALHYHLLPRLLATAELAWAGRGPEDMADFADRLETEIAWLAERGIHGRPLDDDSWKATVRS